jgi:hypothetical protein
LFFTSAFANPLPYGQLKAEETKKKSDRQPNEWMWFLAGLRSEGKSNKRPCTDRHKEQAASTSYQPDADAL